VSGHSGGQLTGHKLEFLSDNGGAYIAHDTRQIARSLGLTPINTPVCSPQSNGMAESFVNTFRRDYESRMDLTDAPTVLAQLAAAFEHFNDVHPHSSLKMRSPREFRRQLVEQMRHAQFEPPVTSLWGQFKTGGKVASRLSREGQKEKR